MALESCLIQTLGFNVLINHAHTVIIKTCQMIKGIIIIIIIMGSLVICIQYYFSGHSHMQKVNLFQFHFHNSS